MSVCSVPSCRSAKNRALSKGISFHQFPADTSLLAKWVFALARKDSKTNALWMPKENSVICSLHFQESCFKDNCKRRVLLKNSVPSLFPGRNGEIVKSGEPEKKRLCTGVSRVLTSTPLVVNVRAQTNSETCLQEMEKENTKTKHLSCVTGRKTSFEQKETVSDSNKSNTKFEELKKKYKTLQGNVGRLKRRWIQAKNNNVELKKINGELMCQSAMLESKGKKCNLSDLQRGVEEKERKAAFLNDQLVAYGKKKMTWSDNSMKCTLLIYYQSPETYRLIRKMNILSLPSRNTLKRYVKASGLDVATIVQQELEQELSKMESIDRVIDSLRIDNDVSDDNEEGDDDAELVPLDNMNDEGAIEL